MPDAKYAELRAQVVALVTDVYDRAAQIDETADAVLDLIPTHRADALATRVCRMVAELPDRNSPAEWPEAMLVTHEELRSIVLGALNDDQPAPQPAAVAVSNETPDGWRDKFAEAVYADLEAADTQDVPLEEYPMRIIKVLDSVVGPRHPAVIHWRNDAIQACIAIAYKYCRDPETFQYLKQDLQSLIFAAPTTQPAAST